MVQQLTVEGGGHEQGVYVLASHIASDQRTEIARMAQMMGRPTPAGAPDPPR